MESVPLVMEPESRLYTDPVVVLDFQVGPRRRGEVEEGTRVCVWGGVGGGGSGCLPGAGALPGLQALRGSKPPGPPAAPGGAGQSRLPAAA
jgi:hypothetical protein